MGKVVLACFFVFVAAVCMIGVAADGTFTWCLANPLASDRALQGNIDYACDKANTWVDCTIIKEGGSCFNPNTLYNHASVAMNMYYQNKNHQKNASDCNFNTTSNIPTGVVAITDPSQGGCKYITT